MQIKDSLEKRGWRRRPGQRRRGFGLIHMRYRLGIIGKIVVGNVEAL